MCAYSLHHVNSLPGTELSFAGEVRRPQPAGSILIAFTYTDATRTEGNPTGTLKRC